MHVPHAALARALVATVAALVLQAPAPAQAVHYVDATGNGAFVDVQSAVDAAADGDVVLVRSGTYPGFAVDGRSLSVVADAGADVRIAGTITVRNTPAGGFVLVADLASEGAVAQVVSRPGLEVLDNAGHVRVQGCAAKGGQGWPDLFNGGDGGPGAVVTNSLRAAFVRCTLTGGIGYGTALFGVHGGDGGAGLVEQGSALALYDCAMKGGAGGDADYNYAGHTAGDGGDGCRVLDYGILASGSSFQGGWGGGQAEPGDGGDGLVVLAAQAQLLDCTYAGGMGGYSYFGTFGQNGQPQSGGGVFNFHAGSARVLAATTLAAESASVAIEITGDPGDQVWLVASPFPGHLYVPSLAGILLVQPPWLSAARPLRVLPGSGTATVVLPTAALTAGPAAGHRFAQALVQGAGGTWRLSSPIHVVTLDCSALAPDCNANGSNDSCDLLLATSVDCDANGVPDECQPDCNANGIADTCDIASGTSPDLNGNGVPDECEPQTTWYVDAAAAPGGNGSPGAPFQTLGEAIGPSISGDTVLVAAGLYAGPGNRAIDFNGRSLTVRGSGAASCIIDCEQQERAFALPSNLSATAVIEGFTFRNGKALNTGFGAYKGGAIYAQFTSLVVRDCVFEDGRAVSNGAAIFSERCALTLERCRFVGNQSGPGGAVWASVAPSTIEISDCQFVDNRGSSGGALYFSGPQTARIARCSFVENVATGNGGALYSASATLFVDHVVFAGNTANRGGAYYDFRAPTVMTNCILVGNSAAGAAGAAYFASGAPPPPASIWRNCVVWDNPSPGAPVEVTYGSLDVAYCDVEGGSGAVVASGSGSVVWGPGNLALDPLFADPDGPDNDPFTYGDNDYRLGAGSPCIDAGDNTTVAPDWFDLDGDGDTTEPVPLDFDLLPRFVDVPAAPNVGNGTPPLVDIGPWERQG